MENGRTRDIVRWEKAKDVAGITKRLSSSLLGIWFLIRRNIFPIVVGAILTILTGVWLLYFLSEIDLRSS